MYLPKYLPKSERLIQILILLSLPLITLKVIQGGIIFVGILAAGLAALTIFFYPFFGFLIMAFFIPMEVMTILTPSMTAIKILGIWTFFCWLVHQTIAKKPIKTDKVFWLMIAFLGWAFMSSLWAMDQKVSLHYFKTLIQLVGLYFLTINLINTERHLNCTIVAFLLGGLICGVLGVKTFLTEGTVSPYYRMAMEGQNPNNFGVIVAIEIIFSWYFISRYKESLNRLFLSVILASFFFCLIFSQSRGAWIALTVAFMVYIFFLQEKNVKSLLNISFLFFVILLVLVLITHFSPENAILVKKRASTISDFGIVDWGIKFDFWQVGFRMWESSPLFGVGLSNFPIAFPQFSITHGLRYFTGSFFQWDPHSDYISIICELGLIGFLIWAAILFSCFKRGKDDKQYKMLMIPLLIILLVIGLKGTYYLEKFYWLILGLIGTSANFNTAPKLKSLNDDLNFIGETE